MHHMELGNLKAHVLKYPLLDRKQKDIVGALFYWLITNQNVISSNNSGGRRFHLILGRNNNR